jgi:hypothetical protein
LVLAPRAPGGPVNDVFFILLVLLIFAFVASLVVAMILYPKLHVIFDPLRVRFEMDAWRPSIRRRRGRVKSQR